MSEAMQSTKAKKNKRKKLKKLILWLILLALAGLAVYLFVVAQLVAGATVTYDKYAAITGTISNNESFSGAISVKNSETLTAGAEATVRKIYVTEMQNVTAGDKLMRLSTGETLEASFDGQINEITVKEGDTVSANTSLIQIVDFNNMKVSLRVDEYSISKLSVGERCTVKVTALDQSFDSSITHINRISQSSGTTAYYTVTAELAVTSDVLPGMQVTVTVPREEAVDAVILSRNALSFDLRNSAYVLTKAESGDMTQTYVELGVDNDNYVQITSGLKAGDEVYKQVETKTESSSGLLSGLSSLFGGGAQQQTQQQAPTGGFPGGNYDMSNMPSGFGNGGTRPNGTNRRNNP